MQYILQEWDNSRFAGWRNVAGTVRDTHEQALELLKEFEAGRGYSIYNTGKYRIKEFST